MGPNALYNRSLDLLNGDGVEKNPEESFRLNAEAAAYDHRDAVLAMGWYYLNGIGVEKDLDKAKSWYKKSARHKDPRAMFSLGNIAYIERDGSDALRWFKRAVLLKHYRSIYWIGKLYWHGRGVIKDRKKAMQLFSEAASKRVKEATRTLTWLNKHKCTTSGSRVPATRCRVR